MSTIGPNSLPGSLESFVAELEDKRLSPSEKGDILGKMGGASFDRKDLPSLKERTILALGVDDGFTSRESIETAVSEVFLPLENQENSPADMLENFTQEQKHAALVGLDLKPLDLRELKTTCFLKENLVEGKKEFTVETQKGRKVTCRIEGERVTLIANNRCVDVGTGTITCNPDSNKISRQDLLNIHDFIVAHKEEVKEGGESIYYSTRSTGLARSFHIDPDGKAFLHLNKQDPTIMRVLDFTAPTGVREVRRGDERKGKGTYKVVTISVDLATGKRYASASMPPEEADKEVAMLEPFKDVDGCLKVISDVRYTSEKKGKPWARLVFPLADGGDLFDLVREGGLSQRQKDARKAKIARLKNTPAKDLTPKENTLIHKKPVTPLTAVEKTILCKKLVNALLLIEGKGILHRDLKLENILITGRGAQIDLMISDFGMSIKESEGEKRKETVGTLCYFSPEYLSAYLDDKATEDDLAHVTTISNDIWAVGVILDEIMHDGRRMSPKESHHPEDMQNNISRHIEPQEPRNKRSMEHLIWSMLRKNPEERMLDSTF